MPKLTRIAPSAAPTNVPRPPTATQIADLDRIGRREFARVDDADLRHIEGPGDAGHHGRDGKDEELVVLDPVAEEAGARSRRREWR